MTWATFWDAFTAIGTVAMAGSTLWVIRQNKSQRQDIARQHQDTFKPVCVLTPDEGLESNALTRILQPYQEVGSPLKFYVVKCSVQNIGTGPAMRLRLSVHFPTTTCPGQHCELPPLGANQSIPSPLKIVVVANGQFNHSSYYVAPDEVWELWLIYEDIFGNVFHTRHSKNPQQPWARFGNGDVK